MHIQKLKLTQFKNHQAQSFDFCPDFNCFHGPNGVGKTNVLDSLHYLSTGRSYFNRKDNLAIKFDEDFAFVDAEIIDEKQMHHVHLGLQENGKKGLTKDGVKIDRLSDYVSFMPCVMITPNDITLLTGLSDERRRFIDRILVTSDNLYAASLSQYNKLILNRNELLKQFYLNQRFDPITLDAFDTKLALLMDEIASKRMAFVEELNTLLTPVYNRLVNNEEALTMDYESDVLNQKGIELLNAHQFADRQAQRTTKGIHKDDLDLRINDVSIRKFGSQGQIKSATIAMKLASYYYLQNRGNVKPLLLLDDVFEKIDDKRATRLLDLISGSDFGQIFITDTSESRLKTMLKSAKRDKKFFNIERPKRRNAS